MLQQPSHSYSLCQRSIRRPDPDYHRAPRRTALHQTVKIPPPENGPSLLSMGGLPSESAIRALVSSAVPGFAVAKIEPVPVVRLHRRYHVSSIDGSHLHLVFPPPPGTGLLRAERFSVRAEASVVQFLSTLIDRHAPASAPSSQEHHLSTYSQSRIGKLRQRVPELVEYGTLHQYDGIVEYIMLRPSCGIPVSALLARLSEDERMLVDCQAEQFFRQIAGILAPNGKFGNARDVLSLTSLLENSKVSPEEAKAPRKRGALCWASGFLSLMEAGLRDLEDVRVQIPYDSVRHHCRRFAHVMNAVTRPGLVVLDTGDDNVLVSRAQDLQGRAGEPTGSNISSSSLDQDGIRHYDAAKVNNQSGGKTNDPQEDVGDVLVTGIRDWSNCVFGDPLLAQVFRQSPERPFSNQHGSNSHQSTRMDGSDSAAPPLIEDPGHAHVRLLLYECYRAVMTIARVFVRVRKDGLDEELESRKAIIDAIKSLNELDDSGHPNHLSFANNASPGVVRAGSEPRGWMSSTARCDGGEGCIHNSPAS